MPIAPITGKLRKAFWRDFSLSLGLGIGSGYAFWYDCAHAQDSLNSVSAVQLREEYYLKLEQERAQAQAAQ
ncbi:cytochrome-c oxidase subunit VIIa [Butyriboletus roseoflavus]|nr:cytochrome-c oxidase subunit VIIa [Butyriboletus roseoflavus]